MLYILLILILVSYPLSVWQKQNKGALAFWFLIPAAIAAVSGIYQAIKGSKARREARGAQNAAISQQAQLASEANQRAQTGLPASQYQQALQNIQRNQAYAVQQLQQRRLGVGGIGAVQQRTNDALLNLDSANSSAKTKNQQIADAQQAKLIALISGVAQNDTDYAAALQSAGIQNIGNAVSSVAQLGSAGAFSNKNAGFSTGNAAYNSLTNPNSRNIYDKVSYKYNKVYA